MIDQKVKDIVKSTVPVLEVHGVAITQAFYRLLFERHPELKNIFNQSNQREGKQPQALANSVYAAALHIDNLEAILPAIQHIGHKHRSLNVKPEHYPIVGEHLLLALKEVLKDAATEEILNAWGAAYGVIAQAFIAMEQQMYSEMLMNNGWEGYKKFIVTERVQETDHISSFYLKPEDKSVIPVHKAGQYITVLGENLPVSYTQPRQYSLSMKPGADYFRISVKKEDGSLVSKHLHETLNVGSIVSITAPAGNFVLEQTQRPIVFISGGIGITPLLSMLYSLQGKAEDVTFIQCSESESEVPFLKEIQGLHSESNFDHQVWIRDSSRNESILGTKYHSGWITTEWIRENLNSESVYYFCGPVGFMQMIKKSLEDIGVSEHNMHYEFFGPNVGL